MQKFNFSKNEESKFLEITDFRDRVSDYFVAQLRHLLEEGTVHTENIVAELKYLENPQEQERTISKRQKKFSGGKLRGFWHTHFFNGDLSQQAINYLKILTKDGEFESIAKAAMEESDDPHVFAEVITDKLIGQKFQDFTDNKSWTGDWVIYAKHGGVNYYLMLCKHSLEGEDTDPIYYEMEEKCGVQFPFLFSD